MNPPTLSAIALSIRDNAQRPMDFVSNTNDNIGPAEVRARLVNRGLIDAHKTFLQRVLVNTNMPEAVLNARVILASFFIRSGHPEVFSSDACVEAATAFVDAYDRILNLAADGLELDAETREEFAAVLSRMVEAFRGVGIIDADTSRRRSVQNLRVLIAMRRDGRNLVIDPNNAEGNLHLIERGINALVANFERVFGIAPGASSIDERIVAVFNALGENLPEEL